MNRSLSLSVSFCIYRSFYVLNCCAWASAYTSLTCSLVFYSAHDCDWLSYCSTFPSLNEIQGYSFDTAALLCGRWPQSKRAILSANHIQGSAERRDCSCGVRYYSFFFHFVLTARSKCKPSSFISCWVYDLSATLHFVCNWSTCGDTSCRTLKWQCLHFGYCQ